MFSRPGFSSVYIDQMFAVSPCTLVWPLVKIILLINNNICHVETLHKKVWNQHNFNKRINTVWHVSVIVTLLTPSLSSCGVIYVKWASITLQKEKVTVLILWLICCWDIREIVVIVSGVRRVKMLLQSLPWY